jgi:hypothetical protein
MGLFSEPMAFFSGFGRLALGSQNGVEPVSHRQPRSDRWLSTHPGGWTDPLATLRKDSVAGLLRRLQGRLFPDSFDAPQIQNGLS